MAGPERFIVVEPPTSSEVKMRVREAIDDGSMELDLTLVPQFNETSPEEKVRFRLSQSRYRGMSNEYLGDLVGERGVITLRVYTHKDLVHHRATATMIRAR